MLSRTRFGGPLAVNIGGRAIVQFPAYKLAQSQQVIIFLNVSGYYSYGNPWLFPLFVIYKMDFPDLCYKML
jgi:hypothetical protein